MKIKIPNNIPAGRLLDLILVGAKNDHEVRSRVEILAYLTPDSSARASTLRDLADRLGVSHVSAYKRMGRFRCNTDGSITYVTAEAARKHRAAKLPLKRNEANFFKMVNAAAQLNKL